MGRVAEGDDRAFTELVRRFQGRVINLVSRVLNDREVSDDLAQEVFVRVYVHRRNYRRGSKFSTWLFTIAANLTKNEIRRRVRRRNWFSLEALQEVLNDSTAVLADRKEGRSPGSSGSSCGRRWAARSRPSPRNIGWRWSCATSKGWPTRTSRRF